MFYTGKGDDGTTQLFGDKKKYSKSNVVFEALGALDELNSYLGMCRAESTEGEVVVEGKRETYANSIFLIQNILFIIQAEVAGAEKHIEKKEIKYLEERIALVEKSIPPLTHFVVPGGSVFSAKMDYARTLVRRAERAVVALHENDTGKVQELTLAYLNRLSSFLFALARYDENTKGASTDAPSYS